MSLISNTKTRAEMARELGAAGQSSAFPTKPTARALCSADTAAEAAADVVRA